MQPAQAPGKISEDKALCSQCGKPFPLNELFAFENRNICLACKPAFQQMIAEGAFSPRDMTYGGVRRRFAAAWIDAIILWAATALIGVVLALPLGGDFKSFLGSGLSSLAGIIIGITYYVVMMGKYGATIGKMTLGLQVVRPDGSPIGFGLAAGRYFAQYLNMFTFGIGYLMAIWDKEKRCLHDRICGTRVIRS